MLLSYDFSTVLIGFPPKEIVSYSPSLVLSKIGIKSRETLIVREVPAEERKIREAQRDKTLKDAVGCFTIQLVTDWCPRFLFVINTVCATDIYAYTNEGVEEVIHC